MRRLVAPLVLSLLLAPAAAHAVGGINFAWNDCLTSGGVSSASFACNVNTGIRVAVGSFRVGDASAFPAFCAVEMFVTVHADAPALPPWWQFFNAGSCRQAGLTTSADFSTFTITNCQDPWPTTPFSGVGFYRTSTTTPPVPSNLPNEAQIGLVAAIAEDAPLVQDVEYYGMAIRINNQKSTGTSSCAGCDVPVSLRLDRIRANDRSGTFEDIVVPIESTCITWQGGSPGFCPGATPARNRTWGAVKRLYR